MHKKIILIFRISYLISLLSSLVKICYGNTLFLFLFYLFFSLEKKLIFIYHLYISLTLVQRCKFWILSRENYGDTIYKKIQRMIIIYIYTVKKF